MLRKLHKRKQEQGFTIIEVLIVLAIAGLILLIVFLAVPALQRNARNTQRKNDASAISSAVANSIDNNGGSLPAGLGKDADTTTVDVCALGGGATAGTTACTTTGGGNIETAKLGYYTPANVSIRTTGTASLTATSSTSVVIDEGYGCNTSGTAASATANSRTAAIVYGIESGGSPGYTSECVEQ